MAWEELDEKGEYRLFSSKDEDETFWLFYPMRNGRIEVQMGMGDGGVSFTVPREIVMDYWRFKGYLELEWGYELRCTPDTWPRVVARLFRVRSIA